MESTGVSSPSTIKWWSISATSSSASRITSSKRRCIECSISAWRDSHAHSWRRPSTSPKSRRTSSSRKRNRTVRHSYAATGSSLIDSRAPTSGTDSSSQIAATGTGTRPARYATGRRRRAEAAKAATQLRRRQPLLKLLQSARQRRFKRSPRRLLRSLRLARRQ